MHSIVCHVISYHINMSHDTTISHHHFTSYHITSQLRLECYIRILCHSFMPPHYNIAHHISAYHVISDCTILSCHIWRHHSIMSYLTAPFYHIVAHYSTARHSNSFFMQYFCLQVLHSNGSAVINGSSRVDLENAVIVVCLVERKIAICTTMWCDVVWCAVLYYTVLYYTILYCTVLYYAVLQCNVL